MGFATVDGYDGVVSFLTAQLAQQHLENVPF